VGDKHQSSFYNRDGHHQSSLLQKITDYIEEINLLSISWPSQGFDWGDGIILNWDT
jgi:hypothetical protein